MAMIHIKDSSRHTSPARDIAIDRHNLFLERHQYCALLKHPDLRDLRDLRDLLGAVAQHSCAYSPLQWRLIYQ